MSAGPIVEDDDKLMALLNFFSFGYTVFQYTLLHTAALNSVTAEYLKIIPVINQINDHSNKLILSKISKQDGYTFASKCQDAIDDLVSAWTVSRNSSLISYSTSVGTETIPQSRCRGNLRTGLRLPELVSRE